MMSLTGRVLSVEKPRTEVRGAATVDDGRADDVGTLLKREAPGHAIVDHRLPVVVDADHFLAVDPPHRSRIGSNCEANVRDVARAVHDGHGPEEHVRRRFPERICEVIEVDVVSNRVDGMPRQFRPANGDFVPVTRHHCELIGKEVGLDRRLHGTVRQLALHRNRLEDEPPLNETVSAGCSGWRLGCGQAWRRTTSRAGLGAGTREQSCAAEHGQDDQPEDRTARRVFMVS